MKSDHSCHIHMGQLKPDCHTHKASLLLLTSSQSASRCRASSFCVISLLLLRNQPSKLGDLRKCLQTRRQPHDQCDISPTLTALLQSSSKLVSSYITIKPAPVKPNPVSFQSGCELRSSFLQSLHEVLLDKRSQLGRTLPGTDGLLERHQTGHVSFL